jgi:hypothetical protein
VPQPLQQGEYGLFVAAGIQDRKFAPAAHRIIGSTSASANGSSAHNLYLNMSISPESAPDMTPRISLIFRNFPGVFDNVASIVIKP